MSLADDLKALEKSAAACKAALTTVEKASPAALKAGAKHFDDPAGWGLEHSVPMFEGLSGRLRWTGPSKFQPNAQKSGWMVWASGGHPGVEAIDNLYVEGVWEQGFEISGSDGLEMEGVVKVPFAAHLDIDVYEDLQKHVPKEK